jgi:hypothetical protein
MASTIAELLSYLWSERTWWLVPMVVVLLLLAVLLVLGSAAGIGPFVYTLF